MGPNPVKLEEELLHGSRIAPGAVVCDLGSGTGLTSVFMAKEYGFTVYAADLWSDPDENRRFFRRMGLSDGQVIPVKSDATATVSYTHLDVYKRQLCDHAGRGWRRNSRGCYP